MNTVYDNKIMRRFWVEFFLGTWISAGSPAISSTACSQTGRGLCRSCRGLSELPLLWIRRGIREGRSRSCVDRVCHGRDGSPGDAGGRCGCTPYLVRRKGRMAVSAGSFCCLPPFSPCVPPSSSSVGCCGWRALPRSPWWWRGSSPSCWQPSRPFCPSCSFCVHPSDY